MLNDNNNDGDIYQQKLINWIIRIYIYINIETVDSASQNSIEIRIWIDD